MKFLSTNLHSYITWLFICFSSLFISGVIFVIFQEIESRYNAVLQLYGEKVEEADELRMDLEDIKQMYKQQVTLYVFLNQLNLSQGMQIILYSMQDFDL